MRQAVDVSRPEWRSICIGLRRRQDTPNVMNRFALSTVIMALGWPAASGEIPTGGAPAHLAVVADYPLSLTLDAQTGTGTTTITSRVTVRVDRLMEENRRKRVTDALTYSGYGNFLAALRALPPIGEIGVEARTVEIRYATERRDPDSRRLLLVADRPLFFLSAEPAKPRTGYELTVVELHVDAQGQVTGTMTGAGRVKPSPDGPVLDDFAQSPVRLTTRATRP